MKRCMLIVALLAAPASAQATGLIDTTGVEKDMRDAQKKVKGDVDKETEKHSVKIGDDKNAGGKKAGKKKKKPDSDPPK